MRLRRDRVGAALLAVVFVAACTQDFSAFQVGSRLTRAGGRADAALDSPSGVSGAGGGGGQEASAAAGAGGALPGAGGAADAAAGGLVGVDASAPDADSGSGGVIGAGGDPGSGGAANGGGGGVGGCGASEKSCGAACVPLGDPSSGCAAGTCTPCALPHVVLSGCQGGACVSAECEPGFGDCDPDGSNGCERVVRDDLANCGDCNRTCATTNVASLECTGARCTSTCTLGRANCRQSPVGPDDGCETDVRVDIGSCGGCYNSCGSLRCASSLCGCSQDFQCGGANTCDVGSRRCRCGAGPLCRPGEVCGAAGCRCNNDTPCGGNDTCCQSPGGCFDLQTDPASCGACGHACPVGFACVGGECRCNDDLDCDAGSAGTCDGTGSCVCGAPPCPASQRCLPSGDCG